MPDSPLHEEHIGNHPFFSIFGVRLNAPDGSKSPSGGTSAWVRSPALSFIHLATIGIGIDMQCSRCMNVLLLY